MALAHRFRGRERPHGRADPVNQELHHSEQHWPAGETGPAQVRRRYTTRQKNASSHQNIIQPTDGTGAPPRPEASPPPFGTDADMSPEEGGRLRLLVDGGARCIDVRAKSTAAGTDTHKRPLSARNVLTGEGAVETLTASAHVSPAPRPLLCPCPYESCDRCLGPAPVDRSAPLSPVVWT